MLHVRLSPWCLVTFEPSSIKYVSTTGQHTVVNVFSMASPWYCWSGLVSFPNVKPIVLSVNGRHYFGVTLIRSRFSEHSGIYCSIESMRYTLKIHMLVILRTFMTRVGIISLAIVLSHAGLMWKPLFFFYPLFTWVFSSSSHSFHSFVSVSSVSISVPATHNSPSVPSNTSGMSLSGDVMWCKPISVSGIVC